MHKNIYNIIFSFKLVPMLSILTVSSAVAWLLSVFALERLPDKDQLLPEIVNAPVQISLTDSQRKEFSFEYLEREIKVKPVAGYELWGLVVSRKDIFSFLEGYQEEYAINTRDVCVIWGRNLDADYQKIKFSSGSFFCYFRNTLGTGFEEDDLSNNHLITDNPDIRRLINNVNVGDQIYIKGFLANYIEDDWQSWRNSSVTRTDTGNGACETIFVEEFKILRPNPTLAGVFYKWMDTIFISALGLLIILSLIMM